VFKEPDIVRLFSFAVILSGTGAAVTAQSKNPFLDLYQPLTNVLALLRNYLRTGHVRRCVPPPICLIPHVLTNGNLLAISNHLRGHGLVDNAKVL
jgi:hypothetical protein